MRSCTMSIDRLKAGSHIPLHNRKTRNTMRHILHRVTRVGQCLTIICLLALSGCGDDFAVHTCHELLQGMSMGTTYTIKFQTACELKHDEVAQQVEQRLQQINQRMSTWIPDSELTQLNHFQQRTPRQVSPELFRVLEQALQVSRMTDGAFDITVGPLLQLWGFGADAQSGHFMPPTAARIESVRQNIGHHLIELDTTNHTVRKLRRGIVIDLSAIAKGYGVDQVAELLEQLSVQNYMVELGGEIRTRGLNPQGETWRIGVEKPDYNRRRLLRLIHLPNLGMATSGDYRDFNEYADIHYPHVIDPNTGRPVSHDLASVTVLHPQAMLADALATALLVMGERQALDFATRQGLPVLLIRRDGQQFVENWSPAMAPYLQQTAAVDPG